MSINDLIAAGDAAEAINEILKISREKNYPKIKNIAISLSGQLNDLNDQKDMGVISSSNARIQKNQIVAGLTSLAGKLEKREKDSKDESPIDLGVELDLSNKKSLETMVDRFKLLREKKTFIQEQYDIASDVSQKFTMKKQLDAVNNEIEELKDKISELSASQEATKVENDTPEDATNPD